MKDPDEEASCQRRHRVQPCRSPQDTETDAADTVVATVGGNDITVGHLVAMRALLPEQYQELPAADPVRRSCWTNWCSSRCWPMSPPRT
jgi:lysophospholipase L1-like esterase